MKRMYSKILLILLLCAGCGKLGMDGRSGNKGGDSERTSDSSESIPGYLSDLALIAFEMSKDHITITGQPGAVKGGSTLLLDGSGVSVIALHISESQFERLEGTMAANNAEGYEKHGGAGEMDEGGTSTGGNDQVGSSDDPGGGTGGTTDATEGGENDSGGMGLLGDEPIKVYGERMALVEANDDGSFKMKVERPENINDLIIVSIATKEGANFALVQTKKDDSLPITAMFLQPGNGKRGKYDNFMVLDSSNLQKVSGTVNTEDKEPTDLEGDERPIDEMDPKDEDDPTDP